MITTYTQTHSIDQFMPFGVDFSKKNNHLGVHNTHILEELIDGNIEREYYFQTRKFGKIYLSVVSKLVISDQTWNLFMGTFTKDSDINEFIDVMINNQLDPELLGLIGNNLPKYPEIIGVMMMGNLIYNG